MRKKSNIQRALYAFGTLALILLLASGAYAQQKTVSGMVLDDDGEPLVGVAVVIKGSNTGTITGANGNFSLSGVTDGDILMFSYIQITKELVYTGQVEITVWMEVNKALEEVVVIGYGSMRRGDVTGALATMKVDDNMRGFTPRAQDLLVGKVAGVSIIDSGGAPNGHSFIRIRGSSSLSANNEPLIILDGIYIDSQEINGMGNILSTINPMDIESFTVLKDASATAIYGSRASNGVILITTRKGSPGRATITYDGNFSIGRLRNKVDLLSGDEYRMFLKESYGNLSIYQRMKERQGLVNTNWQNVIFQTTRNTEQNLSVYGTVGEHMPYRVSAGYTDQDGILKTSWTKRYTGSLSLSPSFLNKHLQFDLNSRMTYADNRYADWGAIGAAMVMDPSQAVYDRESPYGGFFVWLGDDNKPIQVATKNPLSMLEMFRDMTHATNFKGNVQIDYRLHFLPQVRLNLNIAMDASNSNGRKVYSEFSPADYMYGGYDVNWDQRIRNVALTAYAKYEENYHLLQSHLDVMAGYEWQHYWREGTTLGHRITQYNMYGDPLLVEDHGYEAEHYLISFFGRLNYSIKNRYLLTFTLRDDGSSRFSKDNRWALFPSLALAWRISEERFFKTSNTVSHLKLRLGWGVTGQQEINIDYGHLRTYLHSLGTEVGYLRGFDNGTPVWVSLLRPEAYNPDLKWESTVTQNIGMDFGMWNNRIEGSVDVYYRRTNDLINLQTKTTAGINFKEFVATNIGSLENRGFEVSLNGHIIRKKNVTWELGVNVACNRSRIKKLSAGDDSRIRLQNGVVVNMVGQAPNMYYLYEQIYDGSGMPIEGLYKDQNNDGMINADDLRPYKKAAPDWMTGINTKLVWKKWDFAMSGHGNFGTWNYNALASNNAGLSPTSVYVSETLLNRPRSAFRTNFQIGQPLSDYYVQNASFMRIDNIILGWSFEKSRNWPIRGRVYTTVQNPFIFTKYQGIDPEVFGGYDGTLYPRPITCLFGLNLNF